ncbi:carbohydrate ABC transporter permease [Dongia deserti]|uniref:carbohydrate ABC transporter permease n=1 Tax=Dongia deserti TaxID=2268030 RepID=UPI000E64A714|nr:carbohydrate ABC transporter permease [Dongia deserti]
MRRLLVHLAALLLFLLCAGPIGLSLFASVVPDQAIFSFPPNWFGYSATSDNYRYIFTGRIPATYLTAGANRNMISDAARQVPAGMLNSMLVALGVMAVNIILGAPAAYAFARLRFRGQTATFLAIVMSRLVPAVALITPFYLLIQAMQLLGTKAALIIVHSVLTLPFTVLILTIFFRRIPRDIEDAALLDGCSRTQVFLRIVLPLSRTSIFATGIFAFILSYAEFLFALVLSGDAANRPLSVVMAALARNTDVSWGLLNASVCLAVIPTVALIGIVWRFVVEALLERGAEFS